MVIEFFLGTDGDFDIRLDDEVEITEVEYSNQLDSTPLSVLQKQILASDVIELKSLLPNTTEFNESVSDSSNSSLLSDEYEREKIWKNVTC